MSVLVEELIAFCHCHQPSHCPVHLKKNYYRQMHSHAPTCIYKHVCACTSTHPYAPPLAALDVSAEHASLWRRIDRVVWDTMVCIRPRLLSSYREYMYGNATAAGGKSTPGLNFNLGKCKYVCLTAEERHVFPHTRARTYTHTHTHTHTPRERERERERSRLPLYPRLF